MQIIKLEQNDDLIALEKAFFEMSAQREIVVYMIDAQMNYSQFFDKFNQTHKDFIIKKDKYYKKYIENKLTNDMLSWEINFETKELYLYD